MEDRIASFKKEVPLLQSYVMNASIAPNTTKNKLSAVEEVKDTPGVGIYLTDKTNKIIIAPKDFVDKKCLDHLNSGKFKKVDKDPSTEIEAKAKQLLEMMFCTEPSLMDMPADVYTYINIYLTTVLMHQHYKYNHC